MNTDMNDWIEIVPARSFQQADASFARWLNEHGLARDSLAAQDIRVDTIRTDEGSARRYLIRASTLREVERKHREDK